jgi:hypothetical protein
MTYRDLAFFLAGLAWGIVGFMCGASIGHLS